MVYNNIHEYCKKNGITIAAFERMCGLGNGSVSKWENSQSEPTLTTLKKIAEATAIPVEKWIK